MKTDHDAESNPLASPSVSAFDDQALVFSIKNSSEARAAVAHCVQHGGEADTAGGLDTVVDYVRKRERSAGKPSVKPLVPGPKLVGEGNCCFAVPEPGKGKLAGLHHLRLETAEDRSRLEDALGKDPNISYVHRPAVMYPLGSDGTSRSHELGHQWGLVRCGFPQVWKDLDDGEGEDPGVIAIIDNGPVNHSKELGGGRVHNVPPTSRGTPSKSNHAVGVAGIIAASRGNNDQKGMAGCCSAKLKVYSVWTEEGFDSEAYYAALRDILETGARVVNISMGTLQADPTSNVLIQECIANGAVVVAAMGNGARLGSPPLFPAAIPEVIAVGATDRFDRKTAGSSTGQHIFISAPGEDVWTTFGREKYITQNGNSFAAPMVAAAVWLALRKQPEWNSADIKKLVQRSVDGKSVKNGQHSPELGYGRLDMVKLAHGVKR